MQKLDGTPSVADEAERYLAEVQAGSTYRLGDDVLDHAGWCELRAVNHVRFTREPVPVTYLEVGAPNSTANGIAVDFCASDALTDFVVARACVARHVPVSADPVFRAIQRQATDVAAACIAFPTEMESAGALSLVRLREALTAVRPRFWAVFHLESVMRLRSSVLARPRAEPLALTGWVSPAAQAAAAGRAMRDALRFPEADRWFGLALQMAEETGDLEQSSRAWGGLAKAYRSRGALPRAVRAARVAVWMGRRSGSVEAHAFAMHDRASLAFEVGDLALGCRLARAALALYGNAHPRAASLMQDAGFALCDAGCFERAARIISIALRRTLDPHHVIVAAGNLARAAGGMGDRPRFESAYALAARTMHEHPHSYGESRAWLSIAQGALTLQDHRLAEEAARKCVSVAARNGERAEEFGGEAVLEAALRHGGITWHSPQVAPNRDADAFADAAERGLV
jgi:tetratricopeptide (TPR) repeat protein